MAAPTDSSAGNGPASDPDVFAGQPARAPELTLRALATGILLGALLTPCNVYSGLKIGWSFNMSIAAGLLGFGFWGAAARVGGRFGRRSGKARGGFSLLESNINQTTASSAASIISGGLVAPIPALAILTGQTLDLPVLMVWVFAVSAAGVVVAAFLRETMIEREGLRFPAGVATAETLKRLYERGREAAARLRLLLGAAALAAGIKLFVDLGLPALGAGAARWSPTLALPSFGALRAASPGGIGLHNLGFAFDPSLLMIGFGAIIGLRAGVSLLIGAVVAWGVLGPLAVARGWAEPGAPGAVWFEPLVTWLLWPGATLIVVSALTSFGLSVARTRWRRSGIATQSAPVHAGGRRAPVDAATARRIRMAWVAGLVASGALIAVAANAIFGLAVWVSLLAVALSFVLAVVAARVTGETGITPVGALGKVTQLTYGALTPGDLTANLMTANVTGGAAGQCADLMHDLKTGHIVGATPHRQIVAQVFGVMTGSVIGAWVYLSLIPDPAAMLITPEWPAPAVATWKAVAEVLAAGFDALPVGAVPAMAAAAVLGVAVPVAGHVLPARWGRWLPSAPALGLAFVVPAWNAISLFLGALLAAALMRVAPDWAKNRTVTLAAGLVAGESLVGVGLAFGSLAG